jgi:Protein of unknown function (DUF2568)
MATTNLALRFLLEIAGFAGTGYAVQQLSSGAGAVSWILGLAALLAVITLWSLVVAPRRGNGLSQAQKDIIGSVVLLVVAGAVWAAGQGGLAIGYGVLVILNAVLLFVFGQDARDRLDAGRAGHSPG